MISLFSVAETRLLHRLSDPLKIQAFLDEVPYSTADVYRSPRSVMRDRVAHCFDGAVFAAAALQQLGYPPRILDLLPDERDDDHLIALFKCNGGWGAIAKSNFVGLRYREPVYRTLRELVMSYFESYYNIARERTLRGYTAPLYLTTFDKLRWQTDDAAMEAIGVRLDHIRQVALLSTAQAASLSLMDRRSYHAGMQGTNPKGLYVPPKRRGPNPKGL